MARQSEYDPKYNERVDRDARTFRGRIRPGPGRAAIEVLPESEDYTVPGTGLKLYLPRPSSHEGFTGKVSVQALPYFDVDTGEKYDPVFLKDQIVVVGKFSGTKITLNRREYIVVRERDIVCEVIPEDNEEIRAESTSQDTTA